MPNEGRYRFRPLTEDDLPVVALWLAEPHMAEWWDDPETEIAAMRGFIGSAYVSPFIVELDGRPVAYLQFYDPHAEQDHPYADQPAGTLGLDVSIGPPEMLGAGHGSAILRQFADELFARGVPRIIIDPNPANARAIRAYEKAGFRAFDRRESVYGPAVMMARDSGDSA